MESPEGVAKADNAATAVDCAHASSDSPPVQGNSLDISNINFNTSEEAVRSHFAGLIDATRILGVSIKKRISSGKESSLGRGTIHFDSAATAATVCQLFNKTILDGRELLLKPSQSNEHPTSSTTLFVGNISPLATEAEIREIFSPFGEIKSLSLPRPPLGKVRRTGFVEYVTENAAQSALLGLEVTYLRGWRLVIERAKEKKKSLRDYQNSLGDWTKRLRSN